MSAQVLSFTSLQQDLECLVDNMEKNGPGNILKGTHSLEIRMHRDQGQKVHIAKSRGQKGRLGWIVGSWEGLIMEL